ncbi:sigma-54 interaction domain-containing protein [Pseudobacteriovorax antillogorgiicola]|uniref:Two-component system, NtrC family, response regulator AtoC n=1 Tax=Pseudobacteriovorax antillogorgiicola TaxID=1513793 RepID=A0A1Y6BQU2_9BACT|nr:sigma 54-interacting transcriptional regulator [Pseudobacteriovorax antillogorgiicola]TCS54709.1 two-component system response regulator AtoC [Pseudobacteriovorax antillogorgiicola]SMF16182.1 two-component system, NtrC family, response regulator AtoC [Pseudobacteriovorax antillogorgiicola]
MSRSLEIVNFHGIITASAKMKSLFETLKRVSRTDSSVLLRGDSGTGKELFAQAIHNLSRRRAKPYRALNCATLSEQLMSSELFGHVKGAFTGATHQHDGLFHVVNEGSIFLDEIAEIPLNLQAKLLRVFQERAFNRVGSTKVEHVNVRFISATHTSLRNMVADGTFREDLMYRLRVIPLFLPKLSDRNEDIQVLTEKFIEEFNQLGYRTIEQVSKDAWDAMMSYPWPGNIRELRNNIEHAFAIGLGDTLHLEDLTPELQGKQPPEETALENIEKELLVKALRDNHGNKGKAAEQLGMSRPTFWRKCKLHNVY